MFEYSEKETDGKSMMTVIEEENHHDNEPNKVAKGVG